MGQGGTGTGVLTTESGVIFSGDTSGNVLALRTSDGKTPWHVAQGGQMQSLPITYELDGRQYVLTTGGSIMFAYVLPQK